MEKDFKNGVLMMVTLTCYIGNLLFMFCISPLNMLIGNVIAWFLVLIIFMGIIVTDLISK
jgi:hypothetical protein